MNYILKYKKILILLLTFLLVFVIYTVNADRKIRYIAIGDSIAAGQNPYGEINYGYTDYIANYLEKNELLKSYTKSFAVSGYRTIDVINDIKNGKTINIDGNDIDIRRALRESNLVTISIGANDFLEKLNMSLQSMNLPQTSQLKNLVDQVMVEVDKTLELVRKYAKGRIILIGYYNPLPKLFQTQEKRLDELFLYTEEKYQEVCEKYKVDYIDIYQVMKKHPEYLPNPFDIHPNIKGYEAISRQIIDFIEKNMQN